jgi:murein DD-endopeptidase MepM/ murein hydrolase activator NlpD
MKSKFASVVSFLLAVTVSPALGASLPPDFAAPSGELEPGSGSGQRDPTVFFPDMRFPLEEGPAYANSQVYRPGGNHGGSGTQCDKVNYKYPWRDNFCETRGWNMPLCPTGRGHQGQDIRPASCEKDRYWTVAVDNGIIASVGKYSVSLQATDGTIYRYLHLNMDRLVVKSLASVKKGERIGLVSDWFGKTPTTIHLHFDAKATFVLSDGPFTAYAPIYTSLVNSYKNLIGP